MTDIDKIAHALWKNEATDSGSSVSVAKRRTLEAFVEIDPDAKAKWRKAARAAIAALAKEEKT